MATKIGVPETPARTNPAATLSKEEVMRYSRHLIMPEVGMDGQLKLKQAKVLCIGTGGLGAPLGLYLAAAGVGRIGLVDFDVVDSSNLQRQVLFGTSDVGRPKFEPPQRIACESESGHRDRHVRDASDERQRARHHSRTTTSSSTARTISRRAFWSTTRACCSANRMCTARFSASRDRPRFSDTRTARATAACIPSRPRRDSCHRAPRAECWACCPESSARSRPWRRSSSSSARAIRWSAACCFSMRWP